MVKKIIPIKKKSHSIMTDNAKCDILNRVKYNYSLFGISDKIEAVKYIIDLESGYSDTEFYTIRYNGAGNISVSRSNSTTIDSSIAIKDDNISIKTDQTQERIENGNNIDVSMNTIVKIKDGKLITNSYINHSRNDSVGNIKQITDMIARDCKEFSGDKIVIVILFPTTKTAPLIRIYNDDISDIDNFEDDSAIINTYYSNYNINVKEVYTVVDSSNMATMKYADKANDVIKYLENESLEMNPDSSRYYICTTGISSESYFDTADDGTKSDTFIVSYKGAEFYGNTNYYSEDNNLQKTDIHFDKTYTVEGNQIVLSKYTESDCSIVTDLSVKDTIKKYFDEYISQYTGVLFEVFNKSAVYKQNHCNNRYILESWDDINGISARINYVEDLFLFYNETFPDGSGVANTIYVLIDLSEGKEVFMSSVKSFMRNANDMVTFTEYRNSNNFRFNKEIVLNMDDHKTKSVKYNGPELTLQITYDNDVSVIDMIDSVIYNKVDDIVYIRDELGIPCAISLRH